MNNQETQLKTKTSPFGRTLGIFAAMAAMLAGLSAVLNHITDLPFVTHKTRWMLHFIPDSLIFIALLASISAVYFYSDVAIFRSLWYVLKHSNNMQVVVISGLILTVFTLGVPVTAAIIDHYSARRFPAKFDRHYALAREAFRNRKCILASSELQKQGTTLSYLNAVFKKRIAVEEREVARRIRDADHLISRYEESLAGGLHFINALMVERAFVICRDCESVRRVAPNLKNQINTALEEYIAGIQALQKGDPASAIQYFKSSQRSCSGLLHQNELLRYASNPQLIEQDAGLRDLIAVYTRTPLAELRQLVLEYPPIQRLRQVWNAAENNSA